MPAEQSPIFPKLRFGQYAAVAASSLVTSNILKGAGSLNSALNSNIHFPIYTTNVDVPGYAVLGVTLAAAVVVCYWVEMAEAHEGKGIPSNMTPPTKEELKKELNSFFPSGTVLPPNAPFEASAPTIVDTSSDEDSSDEGTISTSTPSPPPATQPGNEGGDKELVWREERGKSVLVQKFFRPKSTKKLLNRNIKMAEVAKHNKRTDAWVVIESRCYDITSYVSHHPGGWLPLENMAGKDCTDAFANYHPASVYRTILPSYYIGDVEDTLDHESFTREHREIRQELLRRGLFETNSYYYYLKISFLVLVFSLAVYLTLYPSSKTAHYMGAAMMAVFWQQLAFVGHDVGHNAISHSKAKDTTLGCLLGNAFGGISLGWWKHSHNVHHIVCNSVEHDPDIQHMPLFAVTEDIFDEGKLREAGTYDEEHKGFWTTYHQKWISPDFASTFLVSYQHFLFYPIMAVARFNLYVQGWIFAFTAWKQDSWYAARYQAIEFGTLFVFLSWLTLLVSTLPSGERLGWLLLSHGLAGLLHVQICISHFTMDTYHGHAYNDLSDEWFTMQCVTTMNVDCPRWLDWFHGGLQFQIEHHLFPRLPRHNLREARALVRPFCEKWGVRYHEPTFLECNAELVGGLRDVARKCRRGGLQAVGGFKNTQIYEGLQAEG
ncbi:hypothetical protein TrRE_jg8443 [Triparma retinervis]|uniref:Cytochrome b5 heme-binding domain-containing protein n=1 Tax=Triparma retinervis TaxID=2557542 RepID=A0A9W7AKQ8_9STRA|nr:hypothetical protein TrRE_jg8443 [Triparma retinervis]